MRVMEVDILCLRQGHVHDEHELEGVVEGEPVNSVDHRFEDRQEGVDDPVLYAHTHQHHDT